ncbi:hypothetical protein BY458DRAFT_499967 [Sporodiniella umbellata]|nr:hypothetical protein BY458DRAFT_499967 [Sporodiniella umbellata]
MSSNRSYPQRRNDYDSRNRHSQTSEQRPRYFEPSSSSHLASDQRPRQMESLASNRQVNSEQRSRHSESFSSRPTSYRPPKERKPKYQSTQPSQSHPLNIRNNVPWLTGALSHKNMPKEGSVQKPSVTDVKAIIPKLMKGFRCQTPYAYHHKLAHASLNRPTEFVRQMANPSIPYLKKESWPVFNKYIGAPINRENLKRVCHKATDPGYIVPTIDRPEKPPPSREPGEIISEKSEDPTSSLNVMDFIAGIEASSKNLAPNSQVATSKVKSQPPPWSSNSDVSANKSKTIPPPALTRPIPQSKAPWSSSKSKDSPVNFKAPEPIQRPKVSAAKPEQARTEKRPQPYSAPATKPPPRAGPSKSLTKSESSSRKRKTSKAEPFEYDALSKWKALESVFEFEDEYIKRPYSPTSDLFSLDDMLCPELFCVENNPLDSLSQLAERRQHSKNKAETSEESVASENVTSLKRPESFLERKNTKRLRTESEKRKEKAPPVERRTSSEKATAEKKTVGDRPTSEKKLVSDKSIGNKPTVEKKTIGDKPVIEKKATNDRPVAEKKTVGDKATAEKKTIDDKLMAEKKIPNDRLTAEKKSVVEKPPTEKKTATDRPITEKKPIEKKKLTGDKAVAERPTSDRKLVSERPATEKTSKEKSLASERLPSEKKQTSKHSNVERKPSEASAQRTNSDMELEEGETISPTPSPPSQQQEVRSASTPGKRKQADPADPGRSEKKQATEKAKVLSPNAPSASILSATDPKSSTMEQCRMFKVMFNNLAHTYKKRGDAEKDALKAALDHFQSLCNYIISYYYAEKQSTHVPPSTFSATWKSVFPLADSLLARLKTQGQMLLHGVCLRLTAMMRYHIFDRMHEETQALLTKQLGKADQSGSQKYLQMSSNLLSEHSKAKQMYRSSEKNFSLAIVHKTLPGSIKEVCFDGNVSKGIVIGGEAGTEFLPSFPFAINDNVLHAAIVTKCFLSDIVTTNNISYQEIKDVADFM